MAKRLITQTRQTVYQPFFNAIDWGFVDKVEPKLEFITQPIKIGTIGKDIEVGKRIIGLKGTVEMELREQYLDLVQKSCPWWSSSGSVALVPTSPQDVYQYAKLLTLHPEDMGATQTEDLNLIKAFPMVPINVGRNGGDDDIYKVVFEFFMDRTQFAATPSIRSWGYIGVPGTLPA